MAVPAVLKWVSHLQVLPCSLCCELLMKLRKHLYMEAYSFTSKEVATTLTWAVARGVKVRVVADAKSHGSKYSALTFLVNHKVAVRLNDHYAIIHNKVIITDCRHVKTGSFNDFAAANKAMPKMSSSSATRGRWPVSTRTHLVWRKAAYSLPPTESVLLRQIRDVRITPETGSGTFWCLLKVLL